jgi:hypothetical protein
MASSNPKFKQSGEPALLDRSWFLKDSAWDDPVWVLRPTNALEETKPMRVDWTFSLPSGLRFTDEPFASLLHASRQLIAYIRSHSLSTGLAQRAGTTAGYFLHLRELVRWMEQAGIRQFSDLDGEALLQFQRALASRPGIGRGTLSPATLQKYVYLLIYLYRARGDMDDALLVDPCPGRGRPEAGNGHEDGLRHWPHTPDAIAVALVQGPGDQRRHVDPAGSAGLCRSDGCRMPAWLRQRCQNQCSQSCATAGRHRRALALATHPHSR